MRIVVVSSSVYSETAAAVCVRLSQMGYVPTGLLALRSVNRKTVLRKIGQWGIPRVADYARAKLIPARAARQIRNPYLHALLEDRGTILGSLHEVGKVYGFPVVTCSDQNSSRSVARLKQWSPDLIVFAGGDILRKPLLDVPRLGILNAHLGLLPEIRGMSSPEWSLLNNMQLGVTIHYMDEGIDTGPIVQRCELPDAVRYRSLPELRERLIAFGVEKIADAVTALDRGTISAKPQSQLDKDNQFFVMHERLRALALQRLGKTNAMIADVVHG